MKRGVRPDTALPVETRSLELRTEDIAHLTDFTGTAQNAAAWGDRSHP